MERQVRRGWARHGAVWTGLAGEDGFVQVWSGGVGCGPARQAWHRKDRLGKFRIGTAGEVSLGAARSRGARQARLDAAGQGTARFGRRGVARCGAARNGKARQVRQGLAGYGTARQARRGMARSGLFWIGR